jgi:hypothetical protein
MPDLCGNRLVAGVTAEIGLDTENTVKIIGYRAVATM